MFCVSEMSAFVWIVLVVLTVAVVAKALAVAWINRRCAARGHEWRHRDDGIVCLRCGRNYKDGEEL